MRELTPAPSEQTVDTFCLAGSTSWRRGSEAVRLVASVDLWLEGHWRSTGDPLCRTTASPVNIKWRETVVGIHVSSHIVAFGLLCHSQRAVQAAQGECLSGHRGWWGTSLIWTGGPSFATQKNWSPLFDKGFCSQLKFQKEKTQNDVHANERSIWGNSY